MVFGIKLAPLNIPLEKHIQTLSVAIMFNFLAFGIIICPIFTLYLIFYTRFWWLTLLYLIYFYFDRHTPSTGGRPLKFVRNLYLLREFIKYHTITAHKATETELDPKKNYLFCVFPHGLITTTLFSVMGTDLTNFNQLFPHHQTRVVSLTLQYYIPFLRDFMLAVGGIASDASAINAVLSKPEGGYFVGLLPGGAEESIYSQPHHYRIVLNKRKGFIKLALKNGTSLVPTISFGEPNLMGQVTNKYYGKLVKKFKDMFGFAPIIPKGRGFFQLNFGFIQFSHPLHFVVGDPIDVTKNENPTSEEIEELHAKFKQALIDLFESNKVKFIENAENCHLEIVA